MISEIRYKIIDSTNSEAQRLIRNGMAPEGDFLVRADFQTEGRGQRGNKWLSPDAENLMFSLAFFPDGLCTGDQFMISQAASLAVAGYLIEHGVAGVSIKWPNDIYVGMRKICGILIENSILGRNIQHSIVGVGININQAVFPECLPNPTSLSICLGGRRLSLDDEMASVSGSLARALQSISSGSRRALDGRYQELLLGLGREMVYRSGGKVFKGVALGVDSRGCILIADSVGAEPVPYAFNEVNLIIPEMIKQNI